MSLKKYHEKRDLKRSREPTEKIPRRSSSEKLHFCVQKHDARHLHYDFRLEYRGVLLSWAIPKGPSLNPQDKRLAIRVEDHPLEYQHFEGTIPKGNYGAGTVEIWDHGTYETPGNTTRGDIEKNITQGLKQGHFSVILHGEKLNGEFIFQELKQSTQKNAWLCIKKQDVSSHVPAAESSTSDPLSGGKKAKIPDFISPMLATLVQHPFNDLHWLFEIKWDGYRALAFINRGKVNLKSRNNHLWNQQFPDIANALKKISGSAILDGELVVVNSEGQSEFQLMQNYQKEGVGTLCYYVFDLLYKDGKDIRSLPLIERKTLLKNILKELSHPLILFSDHVVNDGEKFFKIASEKQLEGIIGKKITSTYQSKRSQDWVKIKTTLRQEVVIGGFTEPRGSRKKLGALLIGVYNDQQELNYVGRVGGGFNEKLLQEVYDALQPLIQKHCPFKNPLPKTLTSVTWVQPKLICEVKFSEWTKDNKMRQPIFQGLRTDKKPLKVIKEVPEQIAEIQTNNKQKKDTSKISLTHLEKIYWPQEHYSKGDLIEYYETMSPFILPYLKNRPIMLHRYPNGITGSDFYQKDINFSPPKWLETFPIEHEHKIDRYMLINDLQSLLFAINLGSIDLHPFLSRCQYLEFPDFCVIDLDPHDISFNKVVEVALIIHDLLENISVKHYCKTSGGKGLHICIPLHAKYSYEQSKQFAEIIAHYVHKKCPQTTSLERNPEKRPQKIYLDCLQNRNGQTIVVPYAVRPRPGATVSTPLEWKEVNNKLDPKQFTIKTVPARVKKKGDLFKPILKDQINLKKVLKILEKFI